MCERVKYKDEKGDLRFVLFCFHNKVTAVMSILVLITLSVCCLSPHPTSVFAYVPSVLSGQIAAFLCVWKEPKHLFWHWSKHHSEDYDYNWWRIWIHLSTLQIICCDSESQIPLGQGFPSEAAASVTIYCWYDWNSGLGGNWGQDFEVLSNYPKAKSFKMLHVGHLKLSICQFLTLFSFINNNDNKYCNSI